MLLGPRARLPADRAVHQLWRAGRRRAARRSFASWCGAAAEGAPVAYLVGHREFYSLDFRVTPDVLIPRPETEFLVVTLLDLIKARPTPRCDRSTVADVGTGSGIIAIAVAKHAPQARVTAIDISPAALAVARDNARRLGVAERIEFVESDLFAGVPAEATVRFHCQQSAVCQQRAKWPRCRAKCGIMSPSWRWRPERSGTSVIERLIPQAAERLAPGGSLLLEISPMLQQRVEALLAADNRLRAGNDHQGPGRTGARRASAAKLSLVMMPQFAGHAVIPSARSE